jgi:hypothetical protein
VQQTMTGEIKTVENKFLLALRGGDKRYTENK